MFSKLSNFSGPLSSFNNVINVVNTRLLLSLDSNNYSLYNKSFSFDPVDSIGVTFSSNSVTSQTGGGWNDRGISVERIPLGSPFKLKFKRGATLGDIMCGVSQTPPIDNQATYTRSSFGFYLGYGTGGDAALSVTEGGDFSVNVVTNGSFPASTVYTIVYDGIRVRYYTNDTLFYTSRSVPTDDLFLYILFLQNDKSIIDIEFGTTNPIWNDISGNGRNFNLINSPKYLNQSFYFNSDLSQYATASDIGTLNQFTVDTWFKLKSLPSSNTNPQIITNTFDVGHPYINFAIGFLNGNPIGNSWDGKISGGFFAGDPEFWKYTDGFVPEVETWYNVTLTYDENHLNLYLDGNLYSSVTCSVPTTTSGLGIDIGKRWDLPEFIDGKIDVVNVWNGPLSSTDILNNYNSISPRYVFATASIVLNGSSSIEIPAGNEFALGTSYTIEFWSKASTPSGGSPMTIMAQRDGDSNIDIFYQNGYLVIRNGYTVAAEPTAGVWTHVAIVSDNTALSVYYNGVAQSVSGSGGNLQNNKYPLAIGCRGPLNNFQFFNGSLYGIRINNTVVYSTDFNPYDVALPPTNIPGTVLLIKEYQVSTGNFIDSSYSKTLVNNGATHSTNVPISYRYLRWLMTQTTGPDNFYSGAIQASELVLLYNGATVSWGPSASATNPDGDNVPSEVASKLLDYNITTKWCDNTYGTTSFGTSTIYIDNLNPIVFNSYYYVTANDSPERDPVSWTLAASNDNYSWTILDTQTIVGITSSRRTNTQIFSIV